MTSGTARVRLAAWFVIVLTAGLMPAVGASAGETGRCYSANVPNAMVLPDKTVHGPGLLQVCVERRISPVTVAHSLAVDGRPIGMYLSRTGRGEGTPQGADAVFVFVRNDADQLVLEGYSRPLGEQVRTYRMLQLGG